MFSINLQSIYLVFFLMVVVVYNVYCGSGPCKVKECPSNYCDNKKFNCPLVNCITGTVALTKPQLCRCCPGCYELVGK